MVDGVMHKAAKPRGLPYPAHRALPDTADYLAHAGGMDRSNLAYVPYPNR